MPLHSPHPSLKSVSERHGPGSQTTPPPQAYQSCKLCSLPSFHQPLSIGCFSSALFFSIQGDLDPTSFFSSHHLVSLSQRQASSNDGLHKLCPLPLLLIKTSTPCWLSSTLSLFFTALANVTYGLPLVVQCVVFSPYFTVYLSVLFGTIDSCLPPETSSSSSFQNHIFSIFLAILMKSFSSNHIFLYSVPWKQTVG